jgi:dihydropteroate synthase
LLLAGRYRLALDRPLVMGIVNATPDSFSGDGRAVASAAVDHARRLLDEGADILDVGGESTRPGATDVAEDEELRRVMPVLERLADAGRPLSIDTRKPGVMGRAIAAGAAMINDVNALRAPGALAVAAKCDAAVCLMHMQGEPATMQRAPAYADVVAEVSTFLAERAEACRDAGIARERIVLDPGFGFGKTLEHNLALVASLERIVALGYPVLVGLSRKGSIGALTGRSLDARVHGSVAAALAAVARGASIVRVHDVGATVDALAVWNAVAAAGHEALHKPG